VDPSVYFHSFEHLPCNYFTFSLLNFSALSCYLAYLVQATEENMSGVRVVERAFPHGLCEGCFPLHTCSNVLVKAVINLDLVLHWLFTSTYIHGFNLCVFTWH